jgi:hypothetical protein
MKQAFIVFTIIISLFVLLYIIYLLSEQYGKVVWQIVSVITIIAWVIQVYRNKINI